MIILHHNERYDLNDERVMAYVMQVLDVQLLIQSDKILAVYRAFGIAVCAIQSQSSC